MLSQHVGGAVIVVGSQKIRQQDLQKSLGALEMVGSVILGVVLNRLPVKGPDAYSYTYYSNDDQKSGRSAAIPDSRKTRPIRSNSVQKDLFPEERQGRVFPAGRH